MNFGKLRLVMSLLIFTSVFSTVIADSTTTALSSTLCGIVGDVRTIVGILALTLFLIGGVLFAVSHFLPTNMEFKKSMTAWSQGMIVGGLIGLVIVLIAGPIIGLITNIGVSAGGSVVTLTC